ncbi:helix-turn-helix transcriptional regulator [Aquamicrobium zhengzhouense]|uniref:Helix-turn-helix domain-containing protein n=1 Tax=Aquamicrobium zhengzhouense TaxID=2781738 RepID=A0ABS0SDX0_9HYPH|nr:hypothetical protein [Aquamicrobium zhengzhouense]MBI1621471.1 hypothetical protein [Aquamicrobium zhengzhouense]
MRKAEILPQSLAPVGINREQAAELIGVSATLFDRLVADGKMPDARMLYGRLVWDVAEVVAAFRALPHRSVSVDARSTEGNPWD